MTAIGPWVCDTCGEDIIAAADGYVIWRDSADGPTGFRIIHTKRCDDRDFPSSMPLDSYVGVEGLTHLMTFLSVGPFHLGGDLTGSSKSVASTDEFVDFVRRVQIPGYEQVRSRYADQDVSDALSGSNEWYPYTAETIERILKNDL